jgi:hypothetical protein
MKAKASLVLLAILSSGAGACGNRLLVGNDSDGGPPPIVVPTTGAAGATGAAGTTGGADTTGDAGGGTAGSGTTGASGTGGPSTTTRIVKPLRISGEEAVRRVASILWRDEPSDDLLSQARLGHFKTTDDLYGAIRQMLADPRARQDIEAFFRFWLHLYELESGPTNNVAKDPNVFPEFTLQLGLDMEHETLTFAVNETLSGGTFTTLMTAPYSWLNGPLGKLYGVTVTGVTGDDFKKVDLDPKQRAGLLTQPSLQTIESFQARNSPSRRGVNTLNIFECRQIPESPANITGLGEVTGKTVRQALTENLNQNPNPHDSCNPCHVEIDPPGLAFETFDAIGRWRTTDNGFPLDMTDIGVKGLTDSGQTYFVDGPVPLAQAMAKSRVVQDCYARMWLSHVMGGAVIEDDSLVQSVGDAFRASGLDLKELIATAMLTDLFLAPR